MDMEVMMVSTGVKFSELPENFVRPDCERPKLSEVSEFADVPVIDMQLDDRDLFVRQIVHACSSYGFFQVVNHGISGEVIERMLGMAKEFFDLPVEEKMKLYSNDPLRTVRLSTSFNVRKEKVNNWRDYLRLHCHPLHHHLPDWPSNPPSFREVVGRYCAEVRELGFRLEEAISESLGLERGYLRAALGEQGQHMAINYYPACPQPELTYGLPAHTDPNVLTVLLPDPHVAGLQVLDRDGKWLAFRPHPGALVVNVADQLHAISNGRYKSARHRAIVNSERPRVSIATFICPADDALIAPADQLSDGPDTPPIYRGFKYAEYYAAFWRRSLDKDHCLDLFLKTSL